MQNIQIETINTKQINSKSNHKKGKSLTKDIFDSLFKNLLSEKTGKKENKILFSEKNLSKEKSYNHILKNKKEVKSLEIPETNLNWVDTPVNIKHYEITSKIENKPENKQTKSIKETKTKDTNVVVLRETKPLIKNNKSNDKIENKHTGSIPEVNHNLNAKGLKTSVYNGKTVKHKIPLASFNQNENNLKLPKNKEIAKEVSYRKVYPSSKNINPKTENNILTLDQEKSSKVKYLKEKQFNNKNLHISHSKVLEKGKKEKTLETFIVQATGNQITQKIDNVSPKAEEYSYTTPLEKIDLNKINNRISNKKSVINKNLEKKEKQTTLASTRAFEKDFREDIPPAKSNKQIEEKSIKNIKVNNIVKEQTIRNNAKSTEDTKQERRPYNQNLLIDFTKDIKQDNHLENTEMKIERRNRLANKLEKSLNINFKKHIHFVKNSSREKGFIKKEDKTEHKQEENLLNESAFLSNHIQENSSEKKALLKTEKIIDTEKGKYQEQQQTNVQSTSDTSNQNFSENFLDNSDSQTFHNHLSSQEKPTEENKFQKVYTLSLNFNDTNITAKLRNNTLNLSIILNNSNISYINSLKSDIASILKEQGFNQFNLKIEAKGKKIYYSNNQEREGRREINVKV